MTHLTQKERSLLQDQLSHEEVCIDKYTKYAQKTRNPQLRQLFNEYAQEEQQHYNTIQGLLGQGGQSGQQQGGMQRDSTQSSGQGVQGGKQQSGGAFGGGQGRTQQSGSQQGDTFMSGRVLYGGQVPGTQQPRGYEQRGTQNTQDASPQFMEGRQTMKQMGWTEMSDELTGGKSSGSKEEEAMLNDMLMTEKYVSGTYDTVVFESSSPEVRQAMQHIQKDEQKHGEGIFQYMQQHGMYNPQ